MKVYEPFEEIYQDDEGICRSYHKIQDGWEQIVTETPYLKDLDVMISKFFNKTGELS